jgi:glyoxylase I family protein
MTFKDCNESNFSFGQTGLRKMANKNVTGIGGWFFRAKDPKALTAWYKEHLGISMDNDDHLWSQEAGLTAFAPFPEASDYFGNAEKQWMINFRVRDLDALVAELRAANIEVTVNPEDYPYGWFARMHDPEGNPIELWEPK